VTWGDGDNIIVSGIGSGLWRIPPNSGKPVPLTELVAPEIIHAQPDVLPGGNTVLFVAGSASSDVTTIEAVPTAGGSRKIIVANGGSPEYTSTGHLLYLLRDTLFAVRFDPAHARDHRQSGSDRGRRQDDTLGIRRRRAVLGFVWRDAGVSEIGGPARTDGRAESDAIDGPVDRSSWQALAARANGGCVRRSAPLAR
jgi:hypothetical protein